MIKNVRLAHAISCVIATSALGAPGAHAQDEAADLGPIVVTGSCIRNDAYTAADPVDIIVPTEGAAKGVGSVAQLLRAGSRRLVELHGNIARVKCSREHRAVVAWAPPGDDLPTRCPHCGAYLRPDVVWLEETLPEDALARAEEAARRAEVMLVVGTSAEVWPAPALPRHARAAGARVVEVNPEATPLSDVADDVLRAPSGIALPALVAAVWPDASAGAADR